MREDVQEKEYIARDLEVAGHDLTNDLSHLQNKGAEEAPIGMAIVVVLLAASLPWRIPRPRDRSSIADVRRSPPSGKTIFAVSPDEARCNLGGVYLESHEAGKA